MVVSTDDDTTLSKHKHSIVTDFYQEIVDTND